MLDPAMPLNTLECQAFFSRQIPQDGYWPTDVAQRAVALFDIQHFLAIDAALPYEGHLEAKRILKTQGFISPHRKTYLNTDGFFQFIGGSDNHIILVKELFGSVSAPVLLHEIGHYLLWRVVGKTEGHENFDDELTDRWGARFASSAIEAFAWGFAFQAALLLDDMKFTNTITSHQCLAAMSNTIGYQGMMDRLGRCLGDNMREIRRAVTKKDILVNNPTFILDSIFSRRDSNLLWRRYFQGEDGLVRGKRLS